MGKTPTSADTKLPGCSSSTGKMVTLQDSFASKDDPNPAQESDQPPAPPGSFSTDTSGPAEASVADPKVDLELAQKRVESHTPEVAQSSIRNWSQQGEQQESAELPSVLPNPSKTEDSAFASATGSLPPLLPTESAEQCAGAGIRCSADGKEFSLCGLSGWIPMGNYLIDDFLRRNADICLQAPWRQALFASRDPSDSHRRAFLQARLLHLRPATLEAFYAQTTATAFTCVMLS